MMRRYVIQFIADLEDMTNEDVRSAFEEDMINIGFELYELNVLSENCSYDPDEDDEDIDEEDEDLESEESELSEEEEDDEDDDLDDDNEEDYSQGDEADIYTVRVEIAGNVADVDVALEEIDNAGGLKAYLCDGDVITEKLVYYEAGKWAFVDENGVMHVPPTAESNNGV